MEDLFKEKKNDKYFNIGCWTVMAALMIFALISFLKDCNKDKLPKPKYFDTGCYIADVDYYDDKENYSHYTATVYVDNNNRLKRLELLNGSKVERVLDSSKLKEVDYEEWGFNVWIQKSDAQYHITIVGRPLEPCEYDYNDSEQDFR